MPDAKKSLLQEPACAAGSRVPRDRALRLIRKSSVILLGILFFGVVGCSDKSADEPATPSVRPSVAVQAAVPAANGQGNVFSFPGATSNELAHMKACFEAIDEGHDAFAIRHARELMDSTNVEVRLQAVEAFGWIGKYAVKELAEMMADADEEVSSEALRQWEMAFDGYSSESSKMREIERAADLLKAQHPLEAVMMKLAELEDYNAVEVLRNIITSTNATPIAAEVARSEYVSLTGEPFVDAKRANQLVTILKNHAEGLAPEPPKGQNFTKTTARSSIPHDQGKENK